MKAVLAHCPELEALTRHARSFAQILTERHGQRPPEWLDAVRQDDLPGLHPRRGHQPRPWRRRRRPHPAWSSGVVERHVNLIKMLKRQMFGRAGFNLL